MFTQLLCNHISGHHDSVASTAIRLPPPFPCRHLVGLSGPSSLQRWLQRAHDVGSNPAFGVQCHATFCHFTKRGGSLHPTLSGVDVPAVVDVAHYGVSLPTYVRFTA